ncbi:pyrroloquinoline quinone biosynthesis peptide chaperone PqqD [Paraburkholderia sp. GAS42]|uniref:pyrroloquinoline quinone biosynthesis peptide chaperone PqqD n=1 Tax=Paraburkholderia sp. GAS42 TaxID=3035135 RepID=UPI003D1F6F3A
MSSPNVETSMNPRPRLRPLFHVQRETATRGWALLSLKGAIELNPSAGEILVRCDGTRELDEIIDELEALFSTSDLAADIYRFIDQARQRGWIE